MDVNQNYAYHLDNLRREYNMTINKLCEGIVDPRNYRRYISGDRTLTIDKLTKFCDKLGISQSDFYYSANEQDRYELRKINQLYGMVIGNDYSKFQEVLGSIKKSYLINRQNERYLEYCLARYNYDNKKQPIQFIMEQISKTINYPNMLKKNAFDFVDIISLQLIAEIESMINKDDALNRLIDILVHQDMIYISTESSKILPTVFANVALLLSRRNKFNDSKEVSSSGVTYSLKYSDLSSLPHLYYTKFYSEKMLGEALESEISAAKCLMISIIRNNDHEKKMFLNVLRKDLGMNPFLLLQKHQEALKSID